MNRLLNQEPTPEQWERFDRHHLREEPKSLMDMSLDELDESWKDYQKLVEIDEKENK